MYSLLIVVLSFALVCSQCNYTMKWFNENHPWNSHMDGNDIERFPLIRAKYPSIFELNRWTGFIDIRKASNQKITDQTMLIEDYTRINDGFICHAINGKQCVDYEIGFCLESSTCGAPKYPPNEKYSAGGTEARLHSFPWHVSIQYEDEHFCDGTLIDDQHILTAASCLLPKLNSLPYSVVLGTHHLSNPTHRVPIDRLRIHSDYNVQTLENNIGLLRLSERIEVFSDDIIPACLARVMRPPSRSNPLIVAGWHSLENETWSVIITDELRQTVLTIMDECSGVYKNYDSNKQICAGRDESSRDSCQGDRGSGLFEKYNSDMNQWVLTGIVSYGCQFASQGYPGVYTRVSAYGDWIQNTIEQMNN